MSGPTAKERMFLASETISAAVGLIREELPTIEAFLKECRDMKSFDRLAGQTTFKNSERRAVSALLEPVFKSAKQLVATYDSQAVRGRAALDAVNEKAAQS